MQTDNREWSDKELQELLKCFGQHIVGIVLAYHRRLENGELENTTRLACLTAFVISLGHHWHMVTAGHLIKDWRPAKRTDQRVQIVGMSLADYFGTNVTRKDPLRVDLFSYPAVHACDPLRDVDYAIIHINQPLRERLAENGILPLTPDESRTGYDDFYSFGLVGFPEEFCEPVENGDVDSRIARVKLTLVPLRREAIPKDRRRQEAFCADVIDMGNQRSVIGMSGGPILGYRMLHNGHTQYELVAIQSRWSEQGRIIGCPIAVALGEARTQLRAQHDNDYE